MSLFEELKRRNVFRVGIAYAISAWVLLQIVDLVLENITAPNWVMQVFMLAIAIGFPVALIFAWAFEMTPDGVKLEKDVDRSKSTTGKTGQKMNIGIIIALIIAVMFLLVDRFRDAPDMASPETTVAVESTEPVAEEAPLEKSIAILPFVDMSPESDQAYFADGISEEILNVLVKTHTLKVAGRTSSFQFRGRNEDLRNIGEQLGVAHILEGSIRKSDNRVRITAQLVKAKDGFQLWSESYDRELTDIFAIQDEIARAITDALAIELQLADNQQSLVTASTNNMDAYDRFLKAKGMIAQRRDFPQSILLLDEATRLDPNFAASWAAYAQALALSIYYTITDTAETLNQAESMANKALKINPNLSMAHSALGDIYRDRHQWIKANDSYLRALSLSPDNVEANQQYAQMLWRASYFEEAYKYSFIAADLDPLSYINLSVNAALRYINGDHAGGWQELHRVLELTGDNLERPYAHRFGVNMALSEGNHELAIEFTELIGKSGPVQTEGLKIKTHYEQLIPLLNSKEEALAFLSAGMDGVVSGPSNNLWTTDVFWAAYFGDFELAAEIIDASVRYQSQSQLTPLDTNFLNFQFLSPLHNSEVYKNLVKNLNLEDFWRKKGFPNYCKPIGADDFECG